MKKKVGILAGTVLILALLTACDNSGSVNKVIFDHEVSIQMSSSQYSSEDETQQGTVLEETLENSLTEMGNDEVMENDEEQILAVYKCMQQAMVDKDTDTLREMMGADTTVRHITGRTQTMDEWLSDVENEEMKYYSIDVTEPKIVIEGDTATLTCSNVIDARIYGFRGTWTLSSGAAFIKTDGEWVMAHHKND